MKSTRKIALILRRIGLEEGVTQILEALHLNTQSIQIKRENWVKNPTPEMKGSRLFYKKMQSRSEKYLPY